MEDITVSIDGSSQDEGIRPTMSQASDRPPAVSASKWHENHGGKCVPDARWRGICGTFVRKGFAGTGTESRMPFPVWSTAIGDDPMMSPKSAVSAAKAILAKTGHSYQEIDAFEVNEAFAVIDVLFERAFPGIEDRYNIWGGALAFGHPYGVSGAMILLHLMKALEYKMGIWECAACSRRRDRKQYSGGESNEVDEDSV